MMLKVHRIKDKRKTDDPDSLGTGGSPLLVPDEKSDDPDSLGTRGSPLLVPDEGHVVSAEPQTQVAPPPRQTCDNPAGSTSGGGKSPDEAVPKKRRWRPYNRVWRRDQKWTREGLTYPQKPPVLQKSDEPGKDLTGTTSPPPLVSDKAVPKQKKRHWTYNCVWQKDKKWIREEQTQQKKVPPPTPVQKDHPTKEPTVPVPRQQEPPQFLRNYWRRNRVWRKDMVWVRKPTPEPETHAANEVQSPTVVPASEKTASSLNTDSKEQTRTPTTDTTPTEGQETASSSATDRVPPPVASDVPPLPPSDKLKTISDRQTDVKQSEDQTAGDSPGGTSQTSDLRSPPPGCTEKQQTGVENQSTRKRKRSSGPCDPSKRQKTALFSPFEVEMQCLEQMFSTLTL